MRMAQETGEPTPGVIGSDPPSWVSDVRAPSATAIQEYDPPHGVDVAGATSMTISDAARGYDPPLREGAAAAVAMAMALAKGFDLGCFAALST